MKRTTTSVLIYTESIEFSDVEQRLFDLMGMVVKNPLANNRQIIVNEKTLNAITLPAPKLKAINN